MRCRSRALGSSDLLFQLNALNTVRMALNGALISAETQNSTMMGDLNKFKSQIMGLNADIAMNDPRHTDKNIKFTGDKGLADKLCRLFEFPENKEQLNLNGTKDLAGNVEGKVAARWQGFSERISKEQIDFTERLQQEVQQVIQQMTQSTSYLSTVLSMLYERVKKIFKTIGGIA